MKNCLIFRALELSALIAFASIITPFSGAKAVAAEQPGFSGALQWDGHAGFQAQVNGAVGDTFVLQTSDDLKNWQSVLTNRFAGAPLQLSDPNAAYVPRRFYRLQKLAPISGAAAETISISDLASRLNAVFLAGEGFNTLQFSPSGRLALLAWRGDELIYCERQPDGRWSVEGLMHSRRFFQPTGYDEHRFQPQAALLFDSGSRPHVFVAGANSIQHYQRNGGWNVAENINWPNSGTTPVLFAAALGRNNSLHLALIGSGNSPSLVYGSDKDGSWQWSTVAQITGDPRGFLRQSYAPRFFCLAVDPSNFAHLSFCREFSLGQGPGGYLKPFSALAYASNRTGQWAVETVSTVPDGSGDAALGGSIAIGPNGQPAIASFYNDRAETGSSQWSQLLYHQRDSSGHWNAQTVARNPDGYAAADGDHGTGFAPQLNFDSAGRPHIAFSDHASQHWGNTGQNEYAGQIRHAVYDGGQWKVETVYKQTSPLQEQIIYPSMAIGPGEVAFVGLRRTTTWGADVWPRPVTSSYQVVLLSAPGH